MKDFNIKEAYIRAGYAAKHADKNAYKVSNKPKIQVRVKEIMDARQETNELSMRKVITSLLRLGEKAEEEGNFGNALRAWELLGKYLGMFTDKTEATVKMSHETMTSAELDAELTRKLGILKPEIIAAFTEGTKTEGTA